MTAATRATEGRTARRVATASGGSAVFVGAARNCVLHLPSALKRWDLLGAAFSPAHFIVVENDSSDGTKAVLADWANAGPNRTVICLDGLAMDEVSRTVKLAIARNRLLDEVRSRPAFAAADYLVVMDMDDASLALTPARLVRCMAFPDWDGLFANQFLYFNDVWALRDGRRSADDWVSHIRQATTPLGRRWARLRHLTWRARPVSPFAHPWRVRSAFGGFGIYRLRLALQSRYEGTANGNDICEHVPFNERLVGLGARLYLHPGLINALPRQFYPMARRLGLV